MRKVLRDHSLSVVYGRVMEPKVDCDLCGEEHGMHNAVDYGQPQALYSVCPKQSVHGINCQIVTVYGFTPEPERKLHFTIRPPEQCDDDDCEPSKHSMLICQSMATLTDRFATEVGKPPEPLGDGTEAAQAQADEWPDVIY